MVVYNAVDSIEASILSALSQTFSNYEYIVVDAKSTDGTVQILKKYQNKFTYWISEPDLGIYDAMNKALNHANGDYVLFMGSDDIFVSDDALKSFVLKCDFRPNEIYYGDVIFKQSKIKYDGSFNRFKLATRNICQQAILYPKSVFNDRVFDLKYRIKADYEFNLYLYGNKKFRFKYVDQTLTIFNVQGTSGTSDDKVFEKEKLLLIKNNLGILPFFYAYLRKFAAEFKKAFFE